MSEQTHKEPLFFENTTKNFIYLKAYSRHFYVMAIVISLVALLGHIINYSFHHESIDLYRISAGLSLFAALIPFSTNLFLDNDKYWLLPWTIFIASLGMFIFLEQTFGEYLFSFEINQEKRRFYSIIFVSFSVFAQLLILLPTFHIWLEPKSFNFRPLKRFWSELDDVIPLPVWIPYISISLLFIKPLLFSGGNFQLIFQEFLLSRTSQAAWETTGFIGGTALSLFKPLEMLGGMTPIISLLSYKVGRIKWLLIPNAIWLALTFLNGTRFVFVNLFFTIILYRVVIWGFSIKKALPILVICTTLLLGILAAQFQVRQVGLVSLDENKLLVESKKNFTDSSGFHLFSLFIRATDFAETRRLGYGQGLLFFLVHPIPRFLWPSKPMPVVIDYAIWEGNDPLAEAQFGGYPRVNLTPLVFSEFFFEYNILGIFLVLPFYLLLCIIINSLFADDRNNNIKVICWAILAGCFMMMMRGLFVFTLYTTRMVVLIIGIYLFSRTIKIVNSFTKKT